MKDHVLEEKLENVITKINYPDPRVQGMIYHRDITLDKLLSHKVRPKGRGIIVVH